MNSYFATYVSNSLAGCHNQHVFSLSEEEKRTGRVFYRITVGGTYRYSLLFGDGLDMTYDLNGPFQANHTFGGWTIHSARVACCPSTHFSHPLNGNTKRAQVDEPFSSLTFHGQASKLVSAGEWFCSDPVELTLASGDYLCLEITCSGTHIPYQHESALPVYIKQGDSWVYSTQTPAAHMIGCDRPVTSRIGFIGDSITQGFGPAYNSYEHWNALLAAQLGDDCAYWNLGMGCARAADMATDGVWMRKALQNDTVFVCYGVNDIWRGQRTAEQLMRDLDTIVRRLKSAGKTVVLQTVPPFDYTEQRIGIWHTVNDYIRTDLAEIADFVFDDVPHLCGDEPHLSRFGAHPDERGCRIWADELYTALHSAGTKAKENDHDDVTTSQRLHSFV